MIDDDTKQYAVFSAMLSALALGGIGVLVSLLVLAYAVYITSVVLSVVAVFGIVLSTVLASTAYVWFINA